MRDIGKGIRQFRGDKQMNKETYGLLEDYMICCMTDAAHDKEHVYRVLYNALEIAGEEADVDYDILIAACLLHDIGRKEQFENPALCHAAVGSEKAYRFLLAHGFEVPYAEQVKQCIRTHRYRKNDPPQSLEAKILFDADKLDVTGAIGMEKIYASFYTKAAMEIAKKRQHSAIEFYNSLFQEVSPSYENGIDRLHNLLEGKNIF